MQTAVNKFKRHARACDVRVVAAKSIQPHHCAASMNTLRNEAVASTFRASRGRAFHARARIWAARGVREWAIC
eukprot:10435046-Lingulodinium_polyedra.AAC.1